MRTLIADLDPNGNVTASRLVEFISYDPLIVYQFQHYAKQWLVGDYDDTKMITSEYTLGYESQRARLYLPSDSVLRPVSMSLRKTQTKGKTQAREYWCWVSDYTRGGDVCFEGSGSCQHTPAEIEISCVCISNCDDNGRGGGGYSRGGSSNEVLFDLSCDAELTRGQHGGCTITATKEGAIVTDQYTYTWGSTLGAVASQSGPFWHGKATSDTRVSATVDSDTLSWSTSQQIVVNARSGWPLSYQVHQ